MNSSSQKMDPVPTPIPVPEYNFFGVLALINQHIERRARSSNVEEKRIISIKKKNFGKRSF